MSEAYIGEIRMFGGNFAPVDWAFCNGQEMPISEYEALFSLIGTIYGGDGELTFKLPNLQSRVPIHMGSYAGPTFTQGEKGGVESVTLTTQQIPVHSHAPSAGGSADSNTPQNKAWASWPGTQYTDQVGGLQPMAAQALAPTGGSQPHENMPPFLAVNFIICLNGIFPSRS